LKYGDKEMCVSYEYMTLVELKLRIFKELGVDPDQQQIRFQDQLLVDNDQKLSDFGIGKGSEVCYSFFNLIILLFLLPFIIYEVFLTY
jgi:hypothetical protein